MIAMAVTDLNPSVDPVGGPTFANISTCVNEEALVVSFEDVTLFFFPSYSGTRIGINFSFQAVLYPSGRITVRYTHVFDPTATVGPNGRSFLVGLRPPLLVTQGNNQLYGNAENKEFYDTTINGTYVPPERFVRDPGQIVPFTADFLPLDDTGCQVPRRGRAGTYVYFTVAKFAQFPLGSLLCSFEPSSGAAAVKVPAVELDHVPETPNGLPAFFCVAPAAPANSTARVVVHAFNNFPKDLADSFETPLRPYRDEVRLDFDPGANLTIARELTSTTWIVDTFTFTYGDFPDLDAAFRPGLDSRGCSLLPPSSPKRPPTRSPLQISPPGPPTTCRTRAGSAGAAPSSSPPLLFSRTSPCLSMCGECGAMLEDYCYQDCRGDWRGTAEVDDCGVCSR
jgi:hypothetical protein